MTRQHKIRSSLTWASVSWVVFLVLMAIRVAVGTAAGGPFALFMTFALIVVATLALFAATVAGVRLHRRPLTRTIARLTAQRPEALVFQAMGTDDFFLGLNLFPDPARPIGRAGLKRYFVMAMSTDGVECWTGTGDAPAVRIDAGHIVALRHEEFPGPEGRQETLVLVVRGVRDVQLPLLPISERGTGIKPMDEYDLERLIDEARRHGLLPATRPR